MSRGHRLNDVLHVYTMEQVEAFLEAAEKNRKVDIMSGAVTMRNATQATNQGFTDFIKSLNPTGSAAKRPEKVTREDVGRLKALFGKSRRSKEVTDGGEQ